VEGYRKEYTIKAGTLIAIIITLTNRQNTDKEEPNYVAVLIRREAADKREVQREVGLISLALN